MDINTFRLEIKFKFSQTFSFEMTEGMFAKLVIIEEFCLSVLTSRNY